MNEPQEVLPDPIFTSIRGAQHMLSCGHSKIYELIDAGELERVKNGARSLITIASIRRYAEKLIAA